MAGLCEGGNEPPGSLKAVRFCKETIMLKLIRKRKRNLLCPKKTMSTRIEGYTGRNGEREKSSGGNKISDI
ncbi:hypothetical protein ANN_17844 [Periplaneta americana]|uniref:Uncharacterized protein n=1 Tax=Periplaneta americana TaxID=6978 RepID=A0ABQ8SU40_PERAM|nr:hypothetical protein ANN_17844 [Periplaneta americana]